MALEDRDIERIAKQVLPAIRRMLTEERETAPVGIQPMLLERMVTVEQELKAQRELIGARFEAMDGRFQAVDRRFEAVDRRFEAMDQRFEDMQHYSDRRFAAVNWVMGTGFTLLAVLVSLYQFLGS